MKRILSFSIVLIIFIALNLYAGDLTVTGKLGVGITTPGANLDVSGKTTKFSNYYPTYRWKFGGSNDLSWKTIANVVLGTGTYIGVTFEVDVLNANTNFGSSVNSIPMKYYARMTRSASVQDDTNNAEVSGPIADYIRVVKTATGAYELQVRQISDWKHMEVSARAISISQLGTGGNVLYADSPVNGSTSGTIYTATSVHRDYFTNGYFAGNIGIGTTSPNPTIPLHISKASIADMELQATGGDGSQVELHIVGGGTNANWAIGTNKSAVGGTVDNLYIRKGAGTTGTKLVIKDSGNVGIGTTAPGQKLDVTGNIRASGETIGTIGSGSGQFRAIAGNYGAIIRNDGTNTYIPLLTASGDQYGSWNSLRPLSVHNASGDLYFAASQVYINHDTGNVGIGTTTPDSMLSVGGDGGSTNIWGYVYATPVIYGKTHYTAGHNVGVYGESSTGANLSFNMGVAGKGLGIFGMGVHGDGTYAGIHGTGSRGVLAEGSVYDYYANGSGIDYGSYSSGRWKKNITPIQNALAKVMSLRGVTYDIDKEHGSKHDVGFIGEEVAKVLPEITAPDPDAPGYVTGMDYSRMTPLLLEAIKEQQLQIEELKAEIAKLKQVK